MNGVRQARTIIDAMQTYGITLSSHELSRLYTESFLNSLARSL